MKEQLFDMGDYEILCNRDKTEWILNDGLGSPQTQSFPSMDKLLGYIRAEMEGIELE